MRLHFLICVWCQRFVKQLKCLHRASSHFGHQDEILLGLWLSAEAREHIIQHLKTADNKSL